MEYTKIALESNSSGIELICKDITNVFTKITDDITSTVETHKFKDLITGEIIYTGLDSEEANGRFVGYFIDFISSSEAMQIISSMTEEDKNAYIEYVHNMKNGCSTKKGARR